MKKVAESIRIAVLGLGNLVASDDQAGLAVARRLHRLLDEAPLENVSVLESQRGGFELIDLLSGFTHAVLIDCLSLPDPVPGRVRILHLEDITGSARLINGHEISIGDAFELARRLRIPMPKNVEIFAIEGGDTSTLSEEMTPAVAAVIDPLARAIYGGLAGLARGSGLEADDNE